MKRVFTALILAAIPAAAFAAALTSAAGVLGSALAETKPVQFSATAVHQDGAATTTVTVQGQKEGSGPDKAWVNVRTEWKSGADWMNTEADVRMKSGKAYVRIASATGSPGAPDLASFTALQGQWFTLDAADPAVRRWFTPSASAADLGAPLAVSSGRFQSGYAYTFSAPSGADAVRAALAAALPPLLAPESAASFQATIDTNLSNAFEYGSLSLGPSFSAKAQRQFHAVYVETPGASATLPEGRVRDFFFPGSAAPAAVTSEGGTSSSSAMSSSASSSAAPQGNHDSSMEMQLPSMRSPAAARLQRRLAQQAVIDLHGPEAQDLKLNVLIATSPVQWDSLAAFNADFSDGNGILYRYGAPSSVLFSTRDAYGGLDVLFFDRLGQFISSASMPPCSGDVCPTYAPDRPAAFALEVAAGYAAKHKIGDLWRLSLDWSVTPPAGSTVEQYDRAAVRLLHTRLDLPAPSGWSAPTTTGDDSLRILAEHTASRVRIADIQNAAGTPGDEQARERLYAVLFAAARQNAGVRYAYIVVPTAEQDTFALVVDNFTYASVDVLDANGNGAIDADERAAAPGSLYFYTPFTAAMNAPVFDTSVDGDEACYVPVKSDNGMTVAVLAIVKQMPQ